MNLKRIGMIILSSALLFSTACNPATLLKDLLKTESGSQEVLDDEDADDRHPGDPLREENGGQDQGKHIAHGIHGLQHGKFTVAQGHRHDEGAHRVHDEAGKHCQEQLPEACDHMIAAV